MIFVTVIVDLDFYSNDCNIFTNLCSPARSSLEPTSPLIRKPTYLIEAAVQNQTYYCKMVNKKNQTSSHRRLWHHSKEYLVLGTLSLSKVRTYEKET